MSRKVSTALEHAACAYRSKKNARAVLEVCLGFEALYEFTLESEPAKTLFGFDRPVEIVAYGSGARLLEAFIIPVPIPCSSPCHLCFRLSDLQAVLERCRAQGLDVRTAVVKDHDVFFVYDMDGNLFELKQA